LPVFHRPPKSLIGSAYSLGIRVSPIFVCVAIFGFQWPNTEVVPSSKKSSTKKSFFFCCTTTPPGDSSVSVSARPERIPAA
jgi:hypothetical protein